MSDDGIWGHSSGSKAQHFIMATARPEVFAQYLVTNEIGHKEVLGCYKGVQERAFVLNMDNLGVVFEAGFLTDEESILVLGAYNARDWRKATLYGISSTWERDIGWFRSVPEAEAKAQDAWTYDPSIYSESGGTYFIAK